MIDHLVKIVRRSAEGSFKLSGRRNRTNYIVFQIILILIFATIWVINQILNATNSFGVVQWLFLIPTIIIYAAISVSAFIAGAQRCRDLGWPGWAVFLTILPLAGYVLWFLLLVLPGNKGANKYGKAPKMESGYDLRA